METDRASETQQVPERKSLGRKRQFVTGSAAFFRGCSGLGKALRLGEAPPSSLPCVPRWTLSTRIRRIRPGLALTDGAERAFCNQFDAGRQSDPERSEPDSTSVNPEKSLGNRNPSPRRTQTYIASRHQPAVAPTGPGTLNRHDSIHASGRAIGP